MKNLLAFCMILIFSGLVYQPGKGNIQHADPNEFNAQCAFRTGDIVLRQGKGFISEIFRKSSLNDRHYSHAGIVVVTNGKVLVYHMLQTPSSPTSLRIESISDFCNSMSTVSYAVYRYPFLQSKEHQVNDFLTSLTENNIRFDDAFELSSDSALYCTELVYKTCLEAAGYELPHSTVQNHDYIGLDNLYQNDQAVLVTKQTY